MRIAVLGYYNKNNLGDDRLRDVWISLFPEANLSFFPHQVGFDHQRYKDFDFILIGGGGLVFSEHGIWHRTRDWLRRTQIPVGVAGISINRLDEPVLRDNVRALADVAAFFFVRDRESASLLGDHPKVQVGPDLTWTKPFHPSDRYPARWDFAANLVDRKWDPYRAEELARQIKQLDHIAFPFKIGPEGDDVYLDSLGLQGVDDFNHPLEPLLFSKYYLGSRFHGVIFAVQLLKPFLSLGYDVKVRRFMEDHGLKDLYRDVADPRGLEGMTDYLLANESSIRERLEKVRTRLVAEGVVMKKSIREHVLQGPEPKQGLVPRVRRSVYRRFGL